MRAQVMTSTLRKTRMVFSILFIVILILYGIFVGQLPSALSSLINLIKEGTIKEISTLWRSNNIENITLSLAFLFFVSSAALSLMTLPGIVGGLLLAIITILIFKIYDARLAAAAIMVGSFTTSLFFDTIHIIYDLFNKVKSFIHSKKATKERLIFKTTSQQSGKNIFPLGPLRILSHIDEFNIIDYIGKGTHSAVYRVINNEDGNYYAMKIPLSKDGARVLLKEVEVSQIVSNNKINNKTLEALLSICENEYNNIDVNILSKNLNIHRKNIIKIIKHNIKLIPEGQFTYMNLSSISTPFYVVEELASGDVSMLLESFRSKQTLSKAFIEMTGAVALFQVLTNMVHRDIKPSNFLIIGNPAKSFKIVLTDFATAMRTGVRNSSWSPGTPYYMPPEGLLYSNYKLTFAYDVYSLSVLLYKGVTGSYPMQQYYLIATSRHPLINADYRNEALRVINAFEIGILGTTGAQLGKFRDLAYPPRIGVILEDAETLLSYIDSFLEESRGGRIIIEETQTKLEESLKKLGLPLELADVIMDGLRLTPNNRIPNALCTWLRLTKLLGMPEEIA